MSANTLSAAVVPRWIVPVTLESVLIWFMRCSRAKMYVMKSPGP